MNNLSITNGLGYSGVVTIKTYSIKNSKILRQQIIKNRGTVDLFKFLCSCLIQQYNGNNAPRYLDASTETIKFKDNSISELEPISPALSYKSKLSNIQLVSDFVDSTYADISGKNWHAVFSANIVFGQLRSATAPIKSLQLYASQSSQDVITPLAYINLEEEIQLKAGEALIVEWDMSFNNWQLKSST